MADTLQTPPSAAPIIRMEEGRVKKIFDEVMDEIIHRDEKVLACLVKTIQEVTQRCSEHNDALKTIKAQFYAEVEAISEVRLIKIY